MPYTKNSKWINNLNVSPETVKLLEEHAGGELFDITLGDIFLDIFLSPKTVATKAKINK